MKFYLVFQPKSHSDVIDLTDDAENIASKQPRNSAGMTREVQRVDCCCCYG